MKLGPEPQNKNKRNIEKHGADFEDNRKDYSEKKYIGADRVNGRIMIAAFIKRSSDMTRIISFRRANSREQKKFKGALKNRLEANWRYARLCRQRILGVMPELIIINHRQLQ